MLLAIAIMLLCAWGLPTDRLWIAASFTRDAAYGELFPAGPAHELVNAENAVLPQRGLHRIPAFPGLALLFLFLCPPCPRTVRALFRQDDTLPHPLEIRGLLPLPLAPPQTS